MTWEETKRAVSPSGLAELVGEHLERSGGEQDMPHFLHYSQDLSPDACERAIVLRRRRAPKRPLELGERLRMEGGNRVERMVVEAWAKAGRIRSTQVPVRALRPSAWAWTGRADVLLTDGRLVEIKSAAGYAFRALENPASLLATAHQWQTSAYLDALRASHGAERASVFYVDREGSNAPVEIELAPGGLLVPGDAIAGMEARRASLLELPDLPPVPDREVVVRVWKTKAPVPEARLPSTTKADGSSAWCACEYCPFRGISCDPGESVIPATVTKDELDRAVAEAEKRWADGATKTPQEIRVSGPATLSTLGPVKLVPMAPVALPAASDSTPLRIDYLNPDLPELPPTPAHAEHRPEEPQPPSAGGSEKSPVSSAVERLSSQGEPW